jgi:homoserine dehydrogenase
MEDIAFCHENGYVCKLIGSGEEQETTVNILVRPCFVKKEELFASIPSNYNALECESDTLGKAVFVGQGAGSLPTAHAVIQDLLDISQHQNDTLHEREKKMVSTSGMEGVYYIRTKKTALFNADLIDHRVGSDSFLTKKIAFVDLKVAVQSVNDETLFLAEVAE